MPDLTVRQAPALLSLTDGSGAPSKVHRQRRNSGAKLAFLRIRSAPYLIQTATPDHKPRPAIDTEKQRASTPSPPSHQQGFTTRSGQSPTTSPSVRQPSSPSTTSVSSSSLTLTGSSQATNTSGSAHPRLSVSSLLCDDPRRIYNLEVVQQPQRAAEFGSHPLSRLPISPPLVVQLIIKDHAGNTVSGDTELPFLISHLSLYSEDGTTPLDYSMPTPHSPGQQSNQPRLLYGTLVSSPHCLRNLQGRKGIYFLYPDVSVRSRGRYQLMVTLTGLSSNDTTGSLTTGGVGTILAQTRTKPFDVVARNEFVAPPQSPLTQYFVQQGARMSTLPMSSES